jgi:copper resistance protein D
LGDLLAYMRAAHFAATIVAAGTVIFEFAVARAAFGMGGGALEEVAERLRKKWAWLVWVSLAIAVLSGAIWLTLLAAEIYGAPAEDVWRDGGVWTVAAETRFGQVSCLRGVAAILLAGLVGLSRRKHSLPGWLSVTLAILLLIGPAWIGHAGATPGWAGDFPLAADALHLLGAGAWLGGLLPLAMLLAAAWQKGPSWTAVTATAVRRFSLLGVASVGALLASGLVNSWYEVGSLENLVTTSYGRLVLVKLGLFAAMVAIAAVNRFYLTPRLATAAMVRRLYQNCIAEAAFGFAAVAVVGFLGAMAPASHAHHQHPGYGYVPADAAYVHIHSLSGMADVAISPGRVGTAHAIIRLWDENFEPLAAQQLTLKMTAPAAGSKPVTSIASQDQNGNWQIDGIELSQPGDWTAAIDAELSNGRRLTLEAPIVIEPKR